MGVASLTLGAAFSALGGSTNSKKSEDGYRALVKAINASGGLAGRMLVPTYVTVDATASSYQQQAESGCARFRDAKVEVVLSEAASTYYGFASCLAKAGIPLISVNASDAAGFANAPWVFNPLNPSYERGYGAVVDQLVASRYITAKSTIGVVRLACAEIERAWSNTVLPRMKAAGLGMPIEYTLSCAGGFGDAASASAAMQNAVLRFKSSGVDRVFVMGDQEALLVGYFGQQAQSQDYHPGYALSSAATASVLTASYNFPQAQLPQVRGVGWLPLTDVGTGPTLPVENRCITLATKGGLPPRNNPERSLLYSSCSNVFLLEAAVRKGNGSVKGANLRAAVLTLGTSFSSPGITGGSTLFGPRRQDGPQLASEWGYVSSCSCLRQIGKPKALR